MRLKEKLGSQFKAYCVHDIIKHFIIGDVVFTNCAYDEPYELLDKCWDNKSGKDEYNTLLSYFIEIRNQQEIELKLYFDERKRYLDAIQFNPFSAPILSNFEDALSSVNKKIYVAKHYKSDWEYGVILLDEMKWIELTLNQDIGAYGIFHLANPPVGEKWFSWQMNMLKSHYNEVGFEEFQTSRFWK